MNSRLPMENKYPHNTLPLPIDKLPQCWNQEERMSALFSPFRSKSANPQDWISKYKFWQNLIHDWLKYKMRCTFSITDLNETFKRKGCTPLCLTTVVEELLRNNEIIPESEFLKEPCETWASWSIDMFVKRPITWSFFKVKSYVVKNEINKETTYVHLQIVKEIGDTVLCILEEKNENVLVPFSQIVKCYKGSTDDNISDNTVMLALIWLKRMKKVAFTNSISENEVLVKVITNSTHTVTEIEESLYKLTKQENELVKEIQLMEQEKVNIINQTKSELAKGLRQVAKTHLRKKMELEKTIERRAQTLENLRALISTIQDTHSNTAVLSAYKMGSDVLKKLNDSGLSESNVRDIMDDISEAIGEQKEVQSILSETFKSSDSDTDLEQELAELLKLDDNVLPSTRNTRLNVSVEELEHDLKNLHIKDIPEPDKFSSGQSLSTAHKKKVLAEPECA